MRAYACNKCATVVYVSESDNVRRGRILTSCLVAGCAGTLTLLPKHRCKAAVNAGYRKRNRRMVTRKTCAYKTAANDELMKYADAHLLRWDSSEVEFLRANANSRTSIDIALCLGRTMYGVQKKAEKMGIPLLKGKTSKSRR